MGVRKFRKSWKRMREHTSQRSCKLCCRNILRNMLVSAFPICSTYAKYMHISICVGEQESKDSLGEDQCRSTSWIEPECVPDGFQWADPSKIHVGDIFPLFAHWREQQRQHLSPLIWVETCPLLRNASPSFEDCQRYHSDELTCSESSDDDSPV